MIPAIDLHGIACCVTHLYVRNSDAQRNTFSNLFLNSGQYILFDRFDSTRIVASFGFRFFVNCIYRILIYKFILWLLLKYAIKFIN